MQPNARVTAAVTPTKTGRAGVRVGTYITCEAAVVAQFMVTEPVVAVELRVTEAAGVKLQDGGSIADAGPATLALRLTVPLKPLVAVAVIVTVAVWPGETLEVPPLFATLKEAGLPPEPGLKFAARLATFTDPRPEALS
jgi:hypothetical protein